MSKIDKKIISTLDYKRTVLSDGTDMFSVSSYDDLASGRRRFAVYDRNGKRVDEATEKKLIEAKVENPLFAPREDA